MGCLRFLLLRVDRRISEVELLYGFHNGCGENEPSKPFVVGRHHVPVRVDAVARIVSSNPLALPPSEVAGIEAPRSLQGRRSGRRNGEGTLERGNDHRLGAFPNEATSVRWTLCRDCVTYSAARPGVHSLELVEHFTIETVLDEFRRLSVASSQSPALRWGEPVPYSEWGSVSCASDAAWGVRISKGRSRCTGSGLLQLHAAARTAKRIAAAAMKYNRP
jgi:hypothetical protein